MNEYKKKKNRHRAFQIFLFGFIIHTLYTEYIQGLRMATFQQNEIFSLLLLANECFCWIKWLNRHSCNVLHVSMIFPCDLEFLNVCSYIGVYAIFSPPRADINILIFNVYFLFVCLFCLPGVEGLIFVGNSTCPWLIFFQDLLCFGSFHFK